MAKIVKIGNIHNIICTLASRAQTKKTPAKIINNKFFLKEFSRQIKNKNKKIILKISDLIMSKRNIKDGDNKKIKLKKKELKSFLRILFNIFLNSKINIKEYRR